MSLWGNRLKALQSVRSLSGLEKNRWWPYLPRLQWHSLDQGSRLVNSKSPQRSSFVDAFEVAIGADMVAKEEAEYVEENLERLGFITTSCCPAFKRMIETRFPELVEHISPSLSPMHMLAKKIKEDYPNAKVVL